MKQPPKQPPTPHLCLTCGIAIDMDVDYCTPLCMALDYQKRRIAVPNDPAALPWNLFAAFVCGVAVGVYVALFAVVGP